MATPISKPSSRHTKSPTQASPSNPTNPRPSSSSSSSLSSHVAMVELKSRILSSLSKLSDRDTQQIAIDDLEKLIRSLPPEGIPILVNSLTHDPPSAPPDPSSIGSSKHPPLILRRESLKLLASLCTSLPDAASTHLPKIISHIVKRLKDPASDSSVRDACRDVTGTLSSIYVSNESTVGLFVKPLMETMGEQSKAAQAGAAMCLAKVVESANGGGGSVGPLFQRLCPRICKLLSAQGFLAKGALLSVVSSLAQVGAISPQSMQQVLQITRECLENSDWATRKAAADTLSVLSAHSSHLIGDGAGPTLSALEACRFDKVKPVRDSMTEAIQHWKKMTGEQPPTDAKTGESTDTEEKSESKKSKNATNRKAADCTKDNTSPSSLSSSPTSTDSISRGAKGTISLPENSASLLLKRKELNPEFFQKLETRKNAADDLLVEVVVPTRRCLNTQSNQEENNNNNNKSAEELGVYSEPSQALVQQGGRGVGGNYQNTPERRLSGVWGNSRAGREVKAATAAAAAAVAAASRVSDGDEKAEPPSGFNNNNNNNNSNRGASVGEGSSFVNNNNNNNKGGGNWIAVQRQLTHLERQQASLMNMLQDFMGGSHDSMVTLENRVRGLERIVEDMARDLSLPSGRRSFDSSKYNGYHHDYQALGSTKFTRPSDSRIGFADRFMSEPSWRPDPESWDHPYSYTRNSGMGSRRGLGLGFEGGSRRAWEKVPGQGQGPFRLGEGPSARSAWQASKDEATLEAIRVAGEDSTNSNNNNNNNSNGGGGGSRFPNRVAIPELDGEDLTDGNNGGQERGPLWEAWTRAMDSVHVGDLDSAYGEILNTGDAYFLVKLMEQTGPVVDQLSSEVGNEVLHAVGQLLMDESFFDVALTWLQQLTDLVAENGADFLGIPPQGKREILLNLHDVPVSEVPEDWDGPTPDQIVSVLASSWGINLHQLIN